MGDFGSGDSYGNRWTAPPPVLSHPPSGEHELTATLQARSGGSSVPEFRERGRRHPWEIPLVVIAVLGTVSVLLGGFRTLTVTGELPSETASLLFLIPPLFYVTRGKMLAKARVYGVEITPTQFPEAHQMVAEAAAAAGLSKVPDAYVQLGNGVLNAFATGHGFRRFIVLHSDLFEVGGRLRDPAALRFIIGHEVGHIAAGHTSFWRQVATNVFQQLPILGSTLSRAQEYTADNYGYAFCPEGARRMTLLAGGKYLYPEVDFDAMADRARTERGFFVWLVNAMAGHPVNVKRFAALRDRSRPGRLFL
jgi:Zn-dependent protease with chaperone function